MGRSQHAWVHEHFRTVDKPDLKTPCRQCCHCGHEMKLDATQQSAHLKHCVQYQNHLRKQSSLVQTIISRPKTALQKKDLLDQKFAAAVYEGGHAFNLYDKPAIHEAFQLLDPSYTPPGAKILSNQLLEEAYIEKKEKVLQHIAAAKYLNFTTDESDSISSDQIANLSINLLCEG